MVSIETHLEQTCLQGFRPSGCTATEDGYRGLKFWIYGTEGLNYICSEKQRG